MGLQATRWSSSSSNTSPSFATPPQAERKDHAAESEDTSSFGFQSLRGLFGQPERQPRYSRPREPEQSTTSTPLATKSSAGDTKENTVMKVDPTFFRASDTATSEAKANSTLPDSWQETPRSTSSDPSTSGKVGTVRFGRPAHGHFVKAESEVSGTQIPDSPPQTGSVTSVKTTANARRQRRRVRACALAAHADSRGEPITWRKVVRKQPTATVGIASATRNETKPEAGQALSRGTWNPGPPWGLSPEDSETVDSILDPGRSDSRSASTVQPPIATPAPETSNKLTHLTSTGEAHMVDIGSKDATRRIAIASAHVQFSLAETYRQIVQNSNKKGDVLSVARIAGIMAAKRTSDLVPLCHPIPITRVDVDFELIEPGPRHPLTFGEIRYGVLIKSLVECTGPTGVEMEALTSAMGAALTVYDMCKAVDKNMKVDKTQVVYKAGGRSGVYRHEAWVRYEGEKYFASKGLELLPATPPGDVKR